MRFCNTIAEVGLVENAEKENVRTGKTERRFTVPYFTSRRFPPRPPICFSFFSIKLDITQMFFYFIQILTSCRDTLKLRSDFILHSE